MIRYDITIDDKTVSLDMSGHANHAPHGYDIVCSGCSAIVQTALIGCSSYELINGLVLDDGKVKFSCKRTPETEAIVSAAAYGLENLRKQYPSCLEGGEITIASRNRGRKGRNNGVN